LLDGVGRAVGLPFAAVATAVEVGTEVGTEVDVGRAVAVVGSTAGATTATYDGCAGALVDEPVGTGLGC
jgi:hypothetical protein